jgi:hypothetical protein
MVLLQLVVLLLGMGVVMPLRRLKGMINHAPAGYAIAQAWVLATLTVHTGGLARDLRVCVVRLVIHRGNCMEFKAGAGEYSDEYVAAWGNWAVQLDVFFAWVVA